MNRKPYFLVVVICCSTPLWAAPPSPIGGTIGPKANPSMPAFAQGQGILSYYFYNLTDQNCQLTPKGAGANPGAYSSWGQNNGWMNSGEYSAPGLFNPDGIPYVVESALNQYTSGKGTSDYFTSSYVFFDWPYSPLVTPIPPGLKLPGGGNPYSATLVSSAFNNWTWNTPGMGDSWYLSCASPTGTNAEIAIASLATSQNALQSGNTGYYSYDSADQTYWISSNYWYPAYPGWFANADINPVAEGNPSQPDQPCYGGVSPAVYSCSNSYFCLNNQNDYTNPDSASLSWPANPNPCGAGFTAPSAQPGSMIFNWNPSSSAQGGLWSGINYFNYSQLSPYPAMLTLNMPMLPINLSAYVQPNNNNPAQLDPAVSWTPVMGGHFTYAIGDPFIISSFAAKILAYLATVSAPLTNASDLASMSYNLINGANNQAAIFQQNSTASNYVQWLLGSQSSPQNYPGAAQLAAKAYSQAYIAALNNQTTTESVWGKIFKVIADVAVNALVSAINAVPDGKVATALVQGATSVSGALISNLNSTITSAYTTTTNPTLPLSTSAPAVVNPTYSASNLLGIFLTNVAVQSEINALMTSKGYLSFDTNVPPLLSNYTAYFTGGCNSGVGSQAINTLSVINNALQGTCAGTINPPSAGVQNPPVYTNACQGNDCQTNPPASNQLSIWTAILMGSDIVVDPNGWLQLGDSADGITPFEPPTQLYSPNVPSTFPKDAINPSVNTTFNGSTFTLTAQSVQWNSTSGSCSAPALSVTGASTATCEYLLPTPPTLNYMNCVKDQYATGGIIVTFPSGGATSLAATEVELACACIPTYIGGFANSGLITGASSSQPTMTCPFAAASP